MPATARPQSIPPHHNPNRREWIGYINLSKVTVIIHSYGTKFIHLKTTHISLVTFIPFILD